MSGISESVTMANDPQQVIALGSNVVKAFEKQEASLSPSTAEILKDWVKDGEKETIPPEVVQERPAFARFISDCWQVRDQRPRAEAAARCLEGLFAAEMKTSGASNLALNILPVALPASQLANNLPASSQQKNFALTVDSVFKSTPVKEFKALPPLGTRLRIEQNNLNLLQTAIESEEREVVIAPTRSSAPGCVEALSSHSASQVYTQQDNIGMKGVQIKSKGNIRIGGNF